MLSRLIQASQEWLQELPAAQQARDYLNARLSLEAQKIFQFGYFPTQEHFSLVLDVAPEKELVDHGLGYYGFDCGELAFHSPFVDYNLILPYINLYGDPVALVGRTILPEDQRTQMKPIPPKYRTTSFDKSRHLFGLHRAKEAIIQKNSVIIVEGQFDCIQAQMAGLKHTVAVGGSSLTMEQLNLVLRWTDNINLLFDQDEAGQTGMAKVKKNWGDRCNIRFLSVPVGFKDLDEFLSCGGEMVEEWKRMIN